MKPWKSVYRITWPSGDQVAVVPTTSLRRFLRNRQRLGWREGTTKTWGLSNGSATVRSRPPLGEYAGSSETQFGTHALPHLPSPPGAIAPKSHRVRRLEPSGRTLMMRLPGPGASLLRAELEKL